LLAMSGTVTLLATTVVICATVLLRALIARWEPRRRLPGPADPAALLAERFARGEIDEAEYAHRLSVIRLGPPLEIR
jgi:putative membrane protein